MRALGDEWRRAGDSIGFVPTMGALHAGHLSLVRRAREENRRAVVSIFVNPLQFRPGEDFERYPRPRAADLGLLAAAGVDAVYTPAPAAMYPPGAVTRVRVPGLGDRLEGASRPGFLEGVATVVAKLLNTVRPDRAYFGQKDAQQALVVQRLAADLNTGVEIVVGPTVREPDGLALSSRNAYLSDAERRAAVSLSWALAAASAAYRAGEREPGRLQAILLQVLAGEPLVRIDYAVVVDARNLEELRPGAPARALVAAFVGDTRLIDNHLLGDPFPGAA